MRESQGQPRVTPAVDPLVCRQVREHVSDLRDKGDSVERERREGGHEVVKYGFLGGARKGVCGGGGVLKCNFSFIWVGGEGRR